MKQHYSILAALLLAATTTFGAPLTPEQAVERLLNDNTTSAKAKGMARSYTVAHTVKADNGQPAIYAIKGRNGGCMLVGADDVAQPLIGYTDNSVTDFNNLPEAMRKWLEGTAERIATVSAQPERYKTRSTTTMSVKNVVEPLIKTKWDQMEPYNDMCPEYNGEKCITGCGATAMAQVMNYFRWPEGNAQGEITYHPSNWKNDIMLQMDLSKIRFDWDNMLDTYTDGAYTKEQAQAVAQLMVACGYVQDMGYGPISEGSFTSTNNYPELMNKHFGYSDNAFQLYRANTTYERWETSIYNSIAQGSPIIFGGNNFAGGHAFICDGYDGNGRYHFNWGWSGVGDGHFLLDALDPNYVDGGVEDAYSSSQSALCFLHPLKGVEAHEEMILHSGSDTEYTLNGTTLSIKDASANTGVIYNTTGKNLNIAIALEYQPIDANGYETGEATYQTIIEKTEILDFKMIKELQTTVNGNLSDGTYIIQLVTKDLDANNPQWRELDHNPLETNDAFLTVDNGTLSISATPADADVKITSLNMTALCYNSPVEFQTMIENTSDKTVTLQLLPVLEDLERQDGTTLGKDVKVMSTSIKMLTLNPGETVDVSWVTSLEAGKTIMEAHTATVSLYEMATGKMLYTKEPRMTYYPESDPTVTGIKIENCEIKNGVYVVTKPSDIHFTGSVTAENGACAELTYLFVFDKNSNVLNTDYLGVLFLDEGEVSPFNSNISLNKYENGVEYTAALGNKNGNVFMNTETSYVKFIIDDNTGITAVEDNDKTCDIYNALGVLMMRGAMEKDVNTLPKGVYVIKKNGKTKTITTL